MSVLPLYHRVFLTLREQIINGVYDWQKPMPGEVQLAEDLGVARATVRRALDLLEGEGLVVRKQGAGTFAKAFGLESADKRRNLGLLKQDKGHYDVLPGEMSLSYGYTEPGKQLKRQLGLSGDEVFRAIRVRQLNDEPYCFVVTWLPTAIAGKIEWESLGTKPVISAVKDAGHNFVKVNQAVSATVANDETAAAMSVPIGSPLLRVSGLFVDESDKAFMRKDGYFHAESFEYRTTVDSLTDD